MEENRYEIVYTAELNETFIGSFSKFDIFFINIHFKEYLNKKHLFPK